MVYIEVPALVRMRQAAFFGAVKVSVGFVTGKCLAVAKQQEWQLPAG
jgi:hypothetical protein